MTEEKKDYGDIPDYNNDGVIDEKDYIIHQQRQFPFAQSVALKGGAGSIMGYCSGMFAKQVSRIIVFWAGCATTFLAFLSWCDYIKINWKKIDADVFHLVAKATK